MLCQTCTNETKGIYYVWSGKWCKRSTPIAATGDEFVIIGATAAAAATDRKCSTVRSSYERWDWTTY